MKNFSFASGQTEIEFFVTDEQKIFLSRLIIHDQDAPETLEVVFDLYNQQFPLIQIQFSGDNQNDHHARKHLGGLAGAALRYDGHKIMEGETGQDTVLVIFLKSAALYVTFYLYSDSNSVFRCSAEIKNCTNAAIGIEYISSFAIWNIDTCGYSPWDKHVFLHLPTNNWYGEAQWKRHPISALGLEKVNHFSLNRICIQNTGTWSCIGHLPCGMLENDLNGTTFFWQIEHHGSWQWEIGDFADHLYLQLSGPTENENGWWLSLEPDEVFKTVPVSFGVVCGDTRKALATLNQYRRKIKRDNEDSRKLPVIFNDYMNCLAGDPTTEKLIPLIDAAAEAGCEYFCIDCGWYSDGPWWDGVGEWLPSTRRFPGGIHEVLNYIRARNMVPGLWLELEVMGIACPLAAQLPDECFFIRHGRRVIDHQRYQLDFRHPLVIAHADSVIDRLVNDYGVGYIKMDYNINAGVGTETGAFSFGDGLLQHNRAYLRWLERVYERYPELVIENCGSGGLRMDWGLLRYHSIQSVTDQTDYRLMSVIAAAAASAATPEQCAIWSYPLREGNEEEVIVNMVNAMLLRIHQSGHLAELSAERFALVKEGIETYKSIRGVFKDMIPSWPIGLPAFSAPWLAFGLQGKKQMFLAVWRQNTENDSIEITLPFQAKTVQRIYPSISPADKAGDKNLESATLETNGWRLNVRLPAPYTARLFQIDC